MSGENQYPVLKDRYAFHKGSKYSFIYPNRKIGSAPTIVINKDALE